MTVLELLHEIGRQNAWWAFWVCTAFFCEQAIGWLLTAVLVFLVIT